MGFYGSVVRPVAFRFDPEVVHDLAMQVISRGWVKARPFSHPKLEQTLFGTRFPNPLGLAAGFDKNGLALNAWKGLGFGFVEVGTITFHPQSGNPRPRLFRLPDDRALINRMGFNNDGAAAIAERIAGSNPGIPLGVNLGKSRIVELENAVADYCAGFQLTHGLGAYAVVNVSSPNTPGLRSLQERKPLTDILQALREIAPEKPIFVKVSPDLEFDALDEVLDVSLSTGCAGLIATNTTLSREQLSSVWGAEDGGVSGRPLLERSDAVLEHLARASAGRLTLIGVGGIFTADDIYRKISLGAHLVQLYTGWIYGGPGMAPALLSTLVDRLDREGIASLDALRGSALRP